MGGSLRQHLLLPLPYAHGCLLSQQTAARSSSKPRRVLSAKSALRGAQTQSVESQSCLAGGKRLQRTGYRGVSESFNVLFSTPRPQYDTCQVPWATPWCSFVWNGAGGSACAARVRDHVNVSLFRASSTALARLGGGRSSARVCVPSEV